MADEVKKAPEPKATKAKPTTKPVAEAETLLSGSVYTPA